MQMCWSFLAIFYSQFDFDGFLASERVWNLTNGIEYDSGHPKIISTFYASFLGIGMDEKFWKKSQMLSLIGSVNCVNSKNFHLNHHELKNNNEIAS